MLHLTSSAAQEDLEDSLRPPDPACNVDPFVLGCFEAYQTALQPWHEEQLDRIVIEIVDRALEGRPVSHVLLIGHAADWRPTDNTLGLGQGRAAAVATGLRSRLRLHGAGLARLPLTPITLGDVAPAASNATQAGRRLNRRVTVDLLHAPPPPRKIHCKGLEDDALREVVLAIFGRRPKQFEIAKELFETIQRGDTEACRVLGAAVKRIQVRLVCMFLSSFAEAVGRGFEENPRAQMAFVRGAAYAVMDAATGRKRDLERLTGHPVIVQAFRQGYGHLLGRLLALRERTLTRRMLDPLLARIACSGSRKATLRKIYLTILEVIRSEVTSIGSNVFISASGDCVLDYPRIRTIRCRPLAD